MLDNYIPIVLMGSIAILFGVVMANLSRLVGPKKGNYQKLTTYESGMVPVGSTRERVSVKYYVVAMLFIIFDIEIVFLYPWAVSFNKLGLFALFEMLLFIILLFVGYLYAYKKGAFQWD